MKWPNHTDISVPMLDASGALIMTEAYWPYGILKIAIGLIPVVAFWAAPSPGILVLLSPCIVIGAMGIPQLVFSRRFTFFPELKKVRVEGRSFWDEATDQTFDYREVGITSESRWVIATPIHRRFFAMFSFQGIHVAFYSSPHEADVEAAIRRLMSQFRLEEEPNKAPEPTSGTVTPRAEPRVAPVPPVAHL
jgi:hypothetical protein